MATYLQLVKDLARATEVVDPGTISSVAGATGRVAQMAYLVQDAWTQIQNLHGDTWDFLTAEIPETARLTVGIREYTPQSLGLLPTDDEPDIPQWARWDGPSPLSTWPVAADGTETREEETDLTVSSWLEFREAYMRGANAVSDPGLQAQPSVVTVDPLDRLVVYPEPDQSYRLAGYYTRAPQILEADGDVPIVSAEHHPTIVQAAKLLLDHSDPKPASWSTSATSISRCSCATGWRRCGGGTGCRSSRPGPAADWGPAAPGRPG